MSLAFDSTNRNPHSFPSSGGLGYILCRIEELSEWTNKSIVREVESFRSKDWYQGGEFHPAVERMTVMKMNKKLMIWRLGDSEQYEEAHSRLLCAVEAQKNSLEVLRDRLKKTVEEATVNSPELWKKKIQEMEKFSHLVMGKFHPIHNQFVVNNLLESMEKRGDASLAAEMIAKMDEEEREDVYLAMVLFEDVKGL